MKVENLPVTWRLGGPRNWHNRKKTILNSSVCCLLVIFCHGFPYKVLFTLPLSIFWAINSQNRTTLRKNQLSDDSCGHYGYGSGYFKTVSVLPVELQPLRPTLKFLHLGVPQRKIIPEVSGNNSCDVWVWFYLNNLILWEKFLFASRFPRDKATLGSCVEQWKSLREVVGKKLTHRADKNLFSRSS